MTSPARHSASCKSIEPMVALYREAPAGRQPKASRAGVRAKSPPYGLDGVALANGDPNGDGVRRAMSSRSGCGGIKSGVSTFRVPRFGGVSDPPVHRFLRVEFQRFLIKARNLSSSV